MSINVPVVSEQPRITAELFTIPLEHAFLIYAPLRQAAFVANGGTVNLLAELQAGTLGSFDGETESLVEMLKYLKIVDAGEEIAPKTAFSGNPHPTSLTLFLTTACNLRCTYCYAAAGDTPVRRMPLEVAIQGVDFVVKNALEIGVDEIEVNFHGGGEPTANWTTLTDSFQYAHNRCEDHDLRLYGSMATNGVISDRKIDWILEHLEGVSLSFDGLPSVQDLHRPTASGGASSRHVIHTLQRFDQEAFNYGVRMTVTHDQIACLRESVQFVCENFYPRRIQVEPAYQLGRWRDKPSAETQEFIDAYRESQQIAKQHDQYLEFSGARIGTLTNHFCGVTQDSFCLTADGNVSACYEVFLEDSEFANVFQYGKSNQSGTGYEFNLPILNNLRDKTVDKHEFCQGCFAKWTCGGDCYHKSLTVNGPGEFAGTDRCHIIRELTKDQILERIQHSGGVLWSELSD